MNKLIPRSFRNAILAISAIGRYSFPSRRLKIIGVTGTDGKTTTATLIYWILNTAGKKSGLISTIGAKIGNKSIDTGFHVTTPDPVKVQSLLSKMANLKCEYAVLEVTSHGLDQNRVYGINFNISALTNITHEHLDYHKTFQNYVKAKAKLFNSSKTSIINKKYSGLILKYIKKKNTVTFYDDKTLKGKIRQAVIKRFAEPYNLLNATAAILVAKSFGIIDNNIEKSIKTFPSIEGRMEEIKNNRGIKVIVDFAHTPNALENVLQTLRKQKFKNSRIVCIFGCAGERDIEKRPMMAEISTRLADTSIFTAEDPRHENVLDIISQMKNGIQNKKAAVYEIPDRRKAINFAINKLANLGDVIVICGKGHERSMANNGIEYPWSDVKMAQKSLGDKNSL